MDTEKKGLMEADREAPTAVEGKELVDVEWDGLIDVDDLIVILYKHQY